MKRTVIVIAVAVVAALVFGSIWWFTRDDNSSTADEEIAQQLESSSADDNFYGNQTQAPTYAVDPGEGDDGSNQVESLPELSVPMNQTPEYYATTMCDNAQMYTTLNQESNKETMRKWFVEAPPIMEPYANGDERLTKLMDAALDSDGDPEAVLEACNS